MVSECGSESVGCVREVRSMPVICERVDKVVARRAAGDG